jgi:hypothetical protein
MRAPFLGEKPSGFALCPGNGVAEYADYCAKSLSAEERPSAYVCLSDSILVPAAVAHKANLLNEGWGHILGY